MDKIKSKVVALLMVIPLLLILATSSVVKIAEIFTDIPVKSVSIIGESILHFEIDHKNEQGEYDNAYRVQAVVEPANATYNNVRFEAEAVEGKPKAEVIIESDGTVRPLGVGTVKIVAIAGARTASIQITYTSNSVYSVKQTDEAVRIEEGQEIALDELCIVEPADALFNVKSECDNPSKIAFFDGSKKLKGKSRGAAKLKIGVEGIKIDPLTGDVTDCTHELEFDVTVDHKETESGVSFGGEETLECATTDTYTAEFSYSTEKFGPAFDVESITYECEVENVIESVKFELTEDNNVKIIIELSDSAVKGEECVIEVKRGGEVITTVKVVVEKVLATSVKITPERGYYTVGTRGVVFSVEAENSASDFVCEFTSSDPKVVKISTNGKADMRAEGEAIITATLYDSKSGEELDVVKPSLKIEVIDSYKTITFKDQKRGDKNELAIAAYAVNDTNSATMDALYAFSISGNLSSKSSPADIALDSDKIAWGTSDESIATIEKGVITIKSSGEVKISVSSVYNDILGLKAPVKAEITVNCRKDAVEVYDYEDLMYASENGLEVVLRDDVMLAPKMKEDGIDYIAYLNECTFDMQTTADYSFYKDTGKEEEAKIKYCVEFKRSVFGNGYAINGEYITRSGDKTTQTSTGYSVFKGPLDLVKLTDNAGRGSASVKSQDNIVFLVRENDITISNVELKGCSDESITTNDGVNLGLLDYCGTVLEIVGDGCTLEYSKVNNGRTVVRIYGSAWEQDANALSNNVSAYRRKTVITNSILERGREFILKIGTNQAIKNAPYEGDVLAAQAPDTAYEDAAPNLSKTDETSYKVGEDYSKDADFYSKYVLTDVTLKDSVLASAGLFAVGLESKFAGVCLHGYDFSENWKFSELGWKNVAGTSYPAVLRLAGDVRFYDWKDINKVNSDTLIEGSEELVKKLINLDIKTLISNYNATLDGNKIISRYQNVDYVNGAIAYYGGGKNYSYVDISGTSESFNALCDYTIGLDKLGSGAVYAAAGKQPFRFKMYNATTGISVTDQINHMQDGTAYSWVRRTEQEKK